MISEHLPELLAFVSGNLLTLAASYIMVGHKLSYIQGQLSQLLHIGGTVDRHSVAIEGLQAHQNKLRLEMRVVFDKLDIPQEIESN